jgi:hypothetical protein
VKKAKLEARLNRRSGPRTNCFNPPAPDSFEDFASKGEPKWPMSCSSQGMIARFLLVLAGLFVVGMVGAFLLYVSVLTVVTIIAIVVGLVATLALGYLAGSSLSVEPPKATRLRNVTPIDAPRDVIFLPEIVSEKVKITNRIVSTPTNNRAQCCENVVQMEAQSEKSH